VITPSNGSDISQTHYNISALGPTSVLWTNERGKTEHNPLQIKEPCQNK